MKDSRKTKKQLIEELESLRSQLADAQVGSLDEGVAPQAARLDELQKDLRQVVYRYDIVHDQILYISESIRDVLGLEAESLMGKTASEVFSAFVHPDDVSRVRHSWRVARRNARENPEFVAVTDYRAMTSEGLRRMRDRSRYIFDDKGSPIEVVGISTDITEAFRMEQQFRQGMESSGHVLWRFNFKDDCVDYVSPHVEKVLGYSLEELRQWTYEDILSHMPQEEAARYKAAMREAVAHAQNGQAQLNVEYRIAHQSGHEVWLSHRGTLYLDAAGEVEYGVGAVYDITPQRQTQQQLRDINELLGEAIASSQSVIYRYDAKADSVDYFGDSSEACGTKVAETASGSSLEEVILRDIHPDDQDAVRRAIDQAAASGPCQHIPLEIEYRRSRGDDEYCWIRNRAVLVTDDAGAMDRIVGSITDITDKHRTAEEIRQQRDFAESLLQTAQALVVVLDTQGRVIRLNRRVAAVMDMSPEELSGCDWSEVCIAEGGEPLQEHLEEALTSDATCEFIARLRVSGGEDRIVEWFCAPLRGEDGGASGLLMMGRDITESQEHELVRTALVEAIPDMIFRYTADGIATDYRPGTGVDPYVPPDEFLGKTLGEVLPGDVAELIHDAIRRSLATGELVTVEYTLDMADGEHTYEGRVFPSGENEVLNIVRDISESRRTARRLRVSEKNLRAFIEAMPDVAMVLDAEGRYVTVYANETLLYRPPESLCGQRMHDVLPQDVADGAMTAIRETLRTGESQVFEYELDVPAGHRWFEGRTAPFLVGESDGDRVIWMARDVTDRHEAKQQLQRAYEELEARVAERTAELRRSEQEERLFSEQLRRLQEVNAILGQIEDVDELCRRTIELARERLGFGRISIWFLDEDKAHTLGSFGTDEHGQVVDERGARLRIINEYNRDQAVLSGAIPLGVWENIPLRNAQTDIVGHGTMASAGMWDGTDVIGKITADDLLEDSSLPPRQLEILRLLGVTVGHLCTRTRAEEALQTSEERYRQLVESTADMVWSCDLDGRLTFVNGAAETMLGVSPVDCIGRSSFEVMHVEDRREAEERFRWCVENGEGWSGVLLRFLHNTGGTRYVESMARPVFDGDGELTGFTGIDRDITQRREAEEALRKAHLELISARENERRVLAKELHDSVAQDLVVLQLMVSGLRKGGEGQDASAQQISEKLGEAITEIRRICHGLYPPMLESLGLGHALVYLSELYCSAERNVSCECEEAVMTERFSPEVEITLYRIAQEATSNAIRHGKARNVILRLHTANELVHLEVQDDGQGFEPGGGVNKLGLGLQSMKDRATSVDGSLAIESQTGRTVVSASVPAEDSVGEL